MTSSAPTPTVISGLAEVASRYDAIFCDVWGVIHNGRESFPDALDALSRYQNLRGAPVVLVSNSPRPSEDVKAQLHALLVPDHAWSGFVTSGDATRAELMRRAPGPAWAVGPERDKTLYEGTGVSFAGPAEAAFISATGLFSDETETPEDYRADLTLAAARGLPMVCANPDIIVQRGEKIIYCAGALAQLYATLGGEVIMAGKPHAPIYELALEETARLVGKPVDRTRILAVGDGLPTDVTGANQQGIDCLFIAAGIHAVEAFGDDGGLDTVKVGRMLGEAGLSAAFAMPRLVW